MPPPEPEDRPDRLAADAGPGDLPAGQPGERPLELPDELAGLAGPGGLDLGSLLAQAQQVQQQLARAQEELADARVVGTSGGGLVTATVSGTGELVDLAIDPAALQGDADAPESDLAETVADLVLAAVRDAAANAQERAAEAMGPLGPGLGGLPGLPGA